ncbi:phage tail spike protein [Clostridium perfringens]|uniref:phage tail spike protein n=1 Tax=Clostridium perfringens TaxID=1502 RepID=UPI00372D458B
MLKLKDKNKKLVAGLINYKDLCIESTLSTGDKKLSFSLHKEDKFYNLIEEECYIETKTQEYVIKARDVGVDYTRFDCVLNLEELEANIFDRFESVEQTITNAINLAIVGTGWTVNDNTLKKKRTVRCTNKNALEIVQEIKKTYRVDIVFNTLKREIEVYEHLGEDKGTYFIDSLNLTALQVQSDSYKFATRIIAEGKDGLSFSDINNGKNYVENYQYSRKVKTIYWKDERYTVKESLLEDAKAKLEEISKPYTSYNASILNLAELNPKYKNILDYQLGDTITLISRNNKVKDKQRIVKTVEYPLDHSRDTVELANAILKFEDIQQENQETTDTVNNITSDNGTLDSNAIEDNSIEIKKIDNFEANVLKVTKLDVINANIENLHANKADIQDLNAVKATVGQLEATKANITQLNATNAEISKLDTLKANIVDLNSATAKIGVLEAKTTSIDNLLSQKADIKDLNALNANISNALIKKANIAELEAMEAKTNKLIANKADISDLNAANANINSIKADTADIKTLINGNLSSENIQTGGITSDKLTISDGFIKDAMIANVSASKITAGTIDAAKINVVNLNADNLTVGKINGQLLKDGSISGLAIENGAIDNNKVSPNANIEASKININSVVTAINAGSTLLTANKVSIDSEKGTLDVAFNKLNTSLEANKKATESNLTAINIVQGKLSTSIENSKILEGKQKTLEDNYNRTVATVDSLKNTIGEQKTLIDSATGKITSVEVKANTLEKDLSGLTQTVTDTKKVIENNKTSLESKNAELKANIDKVSSSLSSVSNTVDKNNKTLVAKTNTLEQNLNGLTQTVESNKTVTDGKITSVENEAHELKAGLGGLTSKLDTLKSTTDGINKTVSNQGSVINQLKDSINLKVDSSTFTQSTQTINSNINKAKEAAINTANNNISSAIDNLKIDGRNLWLNTGFLDGTNNFGFYGCTNIAVIDEDTSFSGKAITFVSTIGGGIYQRNGGDNNKTIPFEKDENLVISGYFKVTSGAYLRIGLEGTSYYKNFYPIKANAWTKFELKAIGNGNASTFTLYGVAGNAYTIKDIKVEKGTKSTGYTEAPEDLKIYTNKVAQAKADLAQANAIANADGKITEEERKRIQQAQENLNTAISKADKAKKDAILEANRVTELKKQEAISSANSHADSKANEALNNAKAYTNTEITTVNTHLNKNTSEINILKDQIESKVSQTDIDKSIANIQLGERNLLRNTGLCYDAKNWYFDHPGIGRSENVEPNLALKNHSIYFNVNGIKNDSWRACNPDRVSCIGGEVFSASVMLMIPSIDNRLDDGDNIGALEIQFWDSSGTRIKIETTSFRKGTITTDKWYKVVCENRVAPPNAVNVNARVWIKRNGRFWAGNLKLVKGRTIGDWTPAPEDTNQLIIDNIKTVTDKISTVESNLTQKTNSIEAGVRDLNSTTQSITTNVSNINRDLTSKINSNLDAAKSFATDIAIAKANLAKEQAIASADGKITAEEQKRIQQAQDNLNTAISKATEAETKAKSYADSKKQEAIKAAGLDATNKANNALNSAKAFINVEITTVNNKVHNVESNLNILSNEIKSKVSQSDIDKSISEIKLGGRNLLSNTYKFKNLNNWSLAKGPNQNGALELIEDSIYGNVLHTTKPNSVSWWVLANYPIRLPEGKFTVGKEYTISFYAKSKEPVSIDISFIDANGLNSVSSILHFKLTTEWKYYYGTIRANATGNKPELYITSNIGEHWWTMFKLEEGNKPSDWSPAPEDTTSLVEDSIRVIDTKITDVSSSVTQLRDSVTTQINSINSKTHSIETALGGKASKQEVTEVNNRVATIKANLDSITQRVSSTESKTHTLESNLNGKASKQELTVINNKVTEVTASLNGITQRVGNTESRINSLNGQVANAVTRQQFTEFQQSNNKFVMDLASSGGCNLVRNSAFESQDWRNWTKWGSIADPVVWKNNEPSGHKWACKIVTTGSNQGIQQQITGLIIGKVYTFSCKVWSTRGVIGAMVSNAGVYNGNHFGGAQNVWGEINFTFTAKENTTTLYLGVVNNKCTPGDYWVTGIQLTEGNCKQPWSQHPNENYNTSFTFDNEGLEAKFNDGSHTKMSHGGFEWFDANNMSHAYHCLMEVGIFNLKQYGNGNYTRVKIQLPAYFRNKYFKVIACPSGWSVGQTNLDSLTVIVESYDIANATFTIKAFAHSVNGAYQNNINISWMATA